MKSREFGELDALTAESVRSEGGFVGSWVCGLVIPSSF